MLWYLRYDKSSHHVREGELVHTICGSRVTTVYLDNQDISLQINNELS